MLHRWKKETFPRGKAAGALGYNGLALTKVPGSRFQNLTIETVG